MSGYAINNDYQKKLTELMDRVARIDQQLTIKTEQCIAEKHLTITNRCKQTDRQIADLDHILKQEKKNESRNMLLAPFFFWVKRA